MEYVMGFCTPEQNTGGFGSCVRLPEIYRRRWNDPHQVLMEVGQKEQQRRFEARINDPLRHWKLSQMDWSPVRRWYEYSRARDAMLAATIRNMRHGILFALMTRKELGSIAFLTVGPDSLRQSSAEKVKLPKRKNKDATTIKPRGRKDASSPKNTDLLTSHRASLAVLSSPHDCVHRSVEAQGLTVLMRYRMRRSSCATIPPTS